MSHEVFISYSIKDKSIADAVCHFLEKNKIRCWIAPRDLIPGIPYEKLIYKAIKSAKMLVSIFTKKAILSTNVKREIEIAYSWEIAIIPFRIERVDPAPEITHYMEHLHWLDALTPPLEMHLLKLADFIKDLLIRIIPLRLKSIFEQWKKKINFSEYILNSLSEKLKVPTFSNYLFLRFLNDLYSWTYKWDSHFKLNISRIISNFDYVWGFVLCDKYPRNFDFLFKVSSNYIWFRIDTHFWKSDLDEGDFTFYSDKISECLNIFTKFLQAKNYNEFKNIKSDFDSENRFVSINE